MFNYKLTKNKPETIQLNLGNLCNLACNHCHIEASPSGRDNMTLETADKILNKIDAEGFSEIDLTGGAPEMNPHIKHIINRLYDMNCKIILRSNLTILDQNKYKELIDFFAEKGVRIIASLPEANADTTDSQRGEGTFEKSIKVLKKLNEAGYGKNLKLDLVANPTGDYLFDNTADFEEIQRETLKEKYDITFNQLITMVNTPIKRFKEFLEEQKTFTDYMNLLKKRFNADTLPNVMCINLISVDYQGFVYDCDFNLALGLPIKDYENIHFWEIDFDNFHPEIVTGEHCYACTAGTGSSCQGALVGTSEYNIQSLVKEYYGEDLQSTGDLRTSACCTTTAIPDRIKNALKNVHQEVTSKYYGCGSPVPDLLEDLNILDIGCGTGRDCFVMSQLVGEKGSVTGIDMTKNQIKIAKKYENLHAKRFGFKEPNTTFIHDYVENLPKHIKKESIDIVTSNCVINLIENKADIIKKIYDVLKYGGEFYFSDVYADRRLPDEIRLNKVLYGECLGGSLYYNDFERIARDAGFKQPRIIEKTEIKIYDPEILKLTGNTKFYSITYRLWKIKDFEEKCEDYGHIAIYRGGVEGSEYVFSIDKKHTFEINKPERICGNSAAIIEKTRFAKFFDIIGNYDIHFGAYEDYAVVPSGNDDKEAPSTCSCH